MIEKDELAKMGSALGGLAFVQGPGGNVSVKSGDDLFVKASGKRLRDVAKDGGFAHVSRALAGRALEGDADADTKTFGVRPRPSLEAYFHLLGGPVVAHTHAIGALLHLCASDTRGDDLGGRLRCIPYVRPGRGVALAIRDRYPDLERGVIGLTSHGIVAYGSSADEAIELTQEIDRRARARFGEIESIESRTAAYFSEAAQTAENGVFRRLPPRELPGDRPRYLFPDAVICGSIVRVSEIENPAGVASSTLARFKRATVVLADDGERILCALSPSQLDESIEVVAAHDLVEETLLARGVAAYFDDDEPAQLLGMPSEVYRIQLSGAKLS